MLKFNTIIATCLAIGVCSSAFAQEQTATETPQATDLSAGENIQATPPEPKVETTVFGDWAVNCTLLETRKNCEMNQILKDDTGHAVLDVTLFQVKNAGEIFAGGSFMAPLETLLTAQLTIAVDDALAKRYPFAFCTPVGCISRIGLGAEDLKAYRGGAKATVTIVPAIAPDQKVALEMSLKGFTKAYEMVSAE